MQAASDLLAVHATDAATVYLSLLARCRDATLASVAAAMYTQRRLVRLMAMRRTLFVVAADDVPVIHHAAAVGVAATMRKRLLQQLATIPTDPPVGPDVVGWLAEVERGVERSIAARKQAAADVLSSDEPRLRTALLPTTDKSYDVRRTLTPQILALMAAEGRLVRSAPRGTWTARQHLWEPATTWWPDGIADVPAADVRLVERYLHRFGPATVTDVQWWTGWTLGATRRALAALDVVDVGCGLVLADDAEPGDNAPAEVAALLPALDSTAMGWKKRAWYLPEQWRLLYDRNGNVGPTVWWAGEVVGGWAVRRDGTVATRLVSDRGRAAVRAVAEAVERLHPRLEGAVVSAAFPTPTERELRG